MSEVAIIGAGYYGFKPITDEVSFREGTFLAAMRAYEQCNIDPRKDVDSFIACEEDFNVGIAISNEFAVDQLGGVLKPVSTVTSESLIGLASGYMLIKSGLCDIVVVEAHSKASNLVSPEKILEFAMDPVYERFLNFHPNYLASLEARNYMEKRGISNDDLALIIKKNKENGLLNPRASYSITVDLEAVKKSEKIFDPLSEYDIAQYTDAFVVVVLASKEKAEKLSNKPVWIEGLYWCSESSLTPLRGFSTNALELAAQKVYDRTNLNPKYIDFFEIDDRFSYRELMHIEALKVSNKDTIKKDLREGRFSKEGDRIVNASGGYLATGVPLDAGGLARVYEAFLQLRNEAGQMQLKNANRCLIASWRGIPTSTYAVCALSNGA